jgi:hypothetical protein
MAGGGVRHCDAARWDVSAGAGRRVVEGRCIRAAVAAEIQKASERGCYGVCGGKDCYRALDSSILCRRFSATATPSPCPLPRKAAADAYMPDRLILTQAT